MNKKHFLIPFVLGAALVVCIGAMIHEYPINTSPGLTDFTLLDTWNGSSGAYNSARLSDIRTVMFQSPTFTGTLTVSGTVSTNELGGVNIITNINGTTIPTPFVFGGVSAEDATNAAITVVTGATNEFAAGLGTAAYADTTAFDGNFRAEEATNGLWGVVRTFRYETNQGALTIDLGTLDAPKEWFAFSTNDNFAIAGLSGVSTFGTNVQKFSMIITNTSGATKTITTPAEWIPTGITLYNTNQGFLTGVVYPGMGTNYAYKALQ